MDSTSASTSTQASRRAHRSALQKRRTGLKKKAHELGVYCGIDLCMISYGPEDDAPETWPDNPSAVKSVIGRFSRAHEAGRVKQMVGVGLRDCMTQEKPLGPPYCSWCPELEQCEEEELRTLVSKLDEKLLMLRGKIDELESNTPQTKLGTKASPASSGLTKRPLFNECSHSDNLDVQALADEHS